MDGLLLACVIFAAVALRNRYANRHGDPVAMIGWALCSIGVGCIIYVLGAGLGLLARLI